MGFLLAAVVVLVLTLLQPSNCDEQQPLSRPRRHMESTTTIEFYHEAGGGDGGIRKTQISSSSSSSQQAADSTTGVSHFAHVNAPNLKTFVFSNGRHHSSGINSYATVDFNNNNPFDDVVENLITSEIGGGAYTWVSTSTFTQQNIINGTIKHYVLFSGGNDRNGMIFPSVMYSFQENNDGSLEEPVWEWEAKPSMPARFGALMDLGDIPILSTEPASDRIASSLASRAGNFDIIIAGLGGLDIYSLQDDGSYLRIRNLPVIGPTAAAFVGIEFYNPTSHNGSLDQALLVVMNRSGWRNPEMVFDAPCFFYDYRLNQHYHYFAQQGQTVSVAVIDEHAHMLIGAGGNGERKGQPNLMHKFTIDVSSGNPSSVLVDTEYQLVPGVPMTYDLMRADHPTPTSEDDFATVAFSGMTKTRQVFPFRLPGLTKDYIVEVNEGQPTFVYCRNENGQTFRIIPLPDTQGVQTGNENGASVARAADVIVSNNDVYIVIAMFFTENIVYTVDMALLREAATVTPAPSLNPTTETPTKSPTRKPTELPTEMPTTKDPTGAPTTDAPTPTPTTNPPTPTPTPKPSQMATETPTTGKPTDSPSIAPTDSPSTDVPSTESPTSSSTILSSVSPGIGSPTFNPSVGSQQQQQQQQKDAPLEPKCGSVASSSGYGGVGAEAKGCTRGNFNHGTRKKRIRGQSTSVWP